MVKQARLDWGMGRGYVSGMLRGMFRCAGLLTEERLWGYVSGYVLRYVSRHVSACVSEGSNRPFLMNS